MGTYLPSGRKQKRSVSEMFSEAEDEHYLDCPTADFFIRCGSLMLDAILFSLLLGGLQQLSSATNSVLPRIVTLVGSQADLIPMLREALSYLTTVAKLLLIYGYWFWPVVAFRGTAAKLLLGLRVVDANTGGRLTFAQMVMREVLGKALSVLPAGIGLIIALLRPDHRALHDVVSRTVVKRVHGAP